jgi:hypothetical protein
VIGRLDSAWFFVFQALQQHGPERLLTFELEHQGRSAQDSELMQQAALLHQLGFGTKKRLSLAVRAASIFQGGTPHDDGRQQAVLEGNRSFGMDRKRVSLGLK